MDFRTVTAALLLLTSVAAADDLTVTPVCAELAETDTLSAEEQVIALATFVRALEAADLLVVTQGCREHYRLSHGTENGNYIVRIIGPQKIRFARNPDRKELENVYRVLIDQVLEVEPVKHEDEESEDDDEEEEEEEEEEETEQEEESKPFAFDVVTPDAPSVRTDTTLYAQMIGGSVGVGLGVGLRVPTSESRALDLYASRTSTGERSLKIIGAKLITFSNPKEATSLYFGGGLAYSAATVMTYDGSSVDGAQIESALGVMFMRKSDWRMFLQADLGLRLYGDWTPTFMVSLGTGG